MKWIAFAVCALVLASQAPAQRTLADLQREFAAASQKLAASSPTREQRQELLGTFLDRLGKFVSEEAQGDDRWNGRLMLADLNLALSRPQDALAALRAIDVGKCPPLILITGATMVQHLGEKELRDSWIEAALAKQAPVADAMAMARILMIVLGEVERAEGLIEARLLTAKDDEGRAFVRWHRADMLRDREDLPEDTGFEELAKLAEDLPETYWGGVARDRLRATRLTVGSEAIDFEAETLDEKKISLRSLRGKTVLLAFWEADNLDLPNLVTAIGQLQEAHGDKFAVLSVCLDAERQRVLDAVRRHRIDFPVIGSNTGAPPDAALRWFVEGQTLHVVDAAGKVRALGLHVGTANARARLAETIGQLTK